MATIVFGKFAKFRNGINYVKEETGHSVSMVGVGDFQNRSAIKDYSNLSKVTINSAISCDEELHDGDLLFVRSNGSKNLIGRTIVIKKPPKGITFSGFTIRARIDRAIAIPEFIALVFQTSAIKKQLQLAGGGNGNIANLSQTILNALEIPIPRIEAQEKILSIISIWDTAIEKTEQLISLKQQNLASYRQKLFIDNASSDWPLTALSTYLEEHGTLSPGLTPVYSVSVHKGLINQVEHLGRSFAATDTSHYKLVRPGDIVYTKSPTGDFPYGIIKQSHATRDVIVSPLYAVFSPCSADIGLLVDFFFESPVQTKNYLRPFIQKGPKNTISISNTDFLHGKIHLPKNKDLAKKAALFICAIRNEISLLKNYTEKLYKQKHGLVQMLLTDRLQSHVNNTNKKNILC